MREKNISKRCKYHGNIIWAEMNFITKNRQVIVKKTKIMIQTFQI